MSSASSEGVLTQAQKPVFGPPCSAEIFSRKWLTKIHALWSTYHDSDDPNCIGHTAFISNALDLAVAFDIEARALRFTMESMPERDDFAELAKRTNPVGYTFKNPFTPIEHMAYVVNTMKKEWEGMRNGDLLTPWAWSTFSHVFRTGCDQVIAKVDDAVDKGLWDAEKGLPEDLEKYHRELSKAALREAKYGV